MQHTKIKRLLAKVMSLAIICLIAFTTTAKAGLDYYEIYLGKKLVMKRALNQTLSMESLPINAGNISDQLVIRYSQCNAPNRNGSKRSIALKDANGNTIRQWNFADATNADAQMVIPLKELMQSAKKGKGKMLNLVYTAEGRPDGEKITYIAAGDESVGYNGKKK